MTIAIAAPEITEASCHQPFPDSGSLLDHIYHGIMQISATPTEQRVQRFDTKLEQIN